MRRRLVLCLALLFLGAGWAQPDLFRAATDGDRDAVSAALRAGVDIDVRDAYGQTPLMYAISHGRSVDFVEFLVRNGADPNARTEAGWTPLMYAARDLDGRALRRVVLLLYNAGADPTARNAEGRMATYYRTAEARSSSTAAPPPADEAAPPPQVEAPGTAADASAATPDAEGADAGTERAEANADASGADAPGARGADAGPPPDAEEGFAVLGDVLAREGGFDAACGTRDAYYAEQWCGYRGASMPFDSFLGHWKAALRSALPGTDVPEPRVDWSVERGVHVAFYDLFGGRLGVSFDADAGLVMLTLR